MGFVMLFLKYINENVLVGKKGLRKPFLFLYKKRHETNLMPVRSVNHSL